MIIETFSQNSPEWIKARTGIPTSSNFDKIITTDGNPSKQRTKYLYQLCAERITGIKEEGYKNGAMERGSETEAQARASYELLTGNTVEEVGLCYPDKRKLWACSPDGLVGDDGLVEIKCPLSHTHIGYLLEGETPKAYWQQLQGQLLVTGRKWVDFFSFYPGLRPLLIRVEPDKSFLKTLQVELEVFVKELEELTKKIKGE